MSGIEPIVPMSGIEPIGPMSGMPDMTQTSLAVAVAPRTGKIIKNLLQNGILRFVLKVKLIVRLVLQR